MNTLIERVPRPAHLDASALAARLAEGSPFPIVEPGVSTFVFHGPATSVWLDHYGVGLPDDLRFEQVDDSDWWTLSLHAPSETRLEYKLWVSDTFGRRLIEDPLNTNVAAHAFGSNSVFEAEGYEEPWWALEDPATPTGRLVDFYIDSESLGRRVTATVYLPHGFDGSGARRYPLLVVHDGSDYLQFAAAATSLDNLIHRGGLVPLVGVFVNPAQRLVEYADDARHAAMMVDELLPAIAADVPLSAEPASRCVMGASFGAVAALSLAFRRPGEFGRLVLQSGSFASAGQHCWPRPEELWTPVKRFVQEFMATPLPVAERVFLSCGAYESLICENLAIAPFIKSTGAAVRFAQHLDGHNWESWRDSLGIGLPWLFGDAA